CHNCGECLYACQYAPPHEFGIDAPRAFARVRHRSYEEYAWPRRFASAFRRQGASMALALAAGFTAILAGATPARTPGAFWDQAADGRFYRVVPHSVMVALFGTVGAAVALVLTVGVRRCWKDFDAGPRAGTGSALSRALGDALRLSHLHGAGADC